MAAQQEEYKSDLVGATFPVDGEGRTYHLFVKPGDVNNRVVTCGDVGRVMRFAGLPGFKKTVEVTSPRGFVTISGDFEGVPITIVSSLMGFPNLGMWVCVVAVSVSY
ncbi:nucleoside phosphorylase [Kipferlia bialata]|uniref:Nucleoside phosphorylase n=1 Tax=Kipferlia bialata TaxID=797122 RepID=A0A391NW94_9EUKA|nr:nucleoside phosphorylase [Kipferlia bialata]|eukprot:g10038.t1